MGQGDDSGWLRGCHLQLNPNNTAGSSRSTVQPTDENHMDLRCASARV